MQYAHESIDKIRNVVKINKYSGEKSRFRQGRHIGQFLLFD